MGYLFTLPLLFVHSFLCSADAGIVGFRDDDVASG
jgi:hypothetical protein